MVSRFRQGPRGVVFRDGKLFQFETGSIVVARTWPDVRAWTKTRDRPEWRGCRPEIDLAKAAAVVRKHKRLLAAERAGPPAQQEDRGWQLRLPFPTRERELLRRRAEAWGAWIAPIPESVFRTVSRFSARQFHCLSLVARCREAAELAESNPVLAWAVATFWIFVGRRPPRNAIRTACRLVRRRRRDICTTLGFPGTEATVRLLSKIRPEAASVGRMLRLRAALGDAEVARLLAHVPVVTGNVLAVAERRDALLPHVTPALLHELSEHRGDDRVRRIAWQLLQVIEHNRLIHPGRRGPVFRSISRIREEHARCVEAMADDRFLSTLTFPEPPIAGTPDIVPITTPQDLAAEGRMQRNCAVTFAPAVAHRRCFLYRLLRPERATLAVERVGGRWTLREVAAADNRPVSRAALAAVRRWLEQVAVPVGSGDQRRCLAEAPRVGLGDDDVPF